MSKVNLDAFIPRADFIDASPQTIVKKEITDLNLSHLIKDGISSIYHSLRKPDFQRETNEWDKIKICDLIESVMNNYLIPAIILWKNPSGYIIVIDGAHRLSAIISYINDDYGDRKISQEYFDYQVSEEEKELAQQCREYINSKIGSFVHLGDIFKNPSKYSNEDVIKASNFYNMLLTVQTITNPSAKDAEDSFFKINQQGVPLSATEKKLCKSREYPNAIATRAIMKGGVGHQYWGSFTADNQNALKKISAEINSLLFKPPLTDRVKSGEFYPMGGRPTAAMPVVFDFVNMVNKIDSKNKLKSDKFSGDETINNLIQARKVIWLLNSNDSSSLGLYPLAFFYTGMGAHIQTAFLSLSRLIIEFNSQKKLPKFTVVRSAFENFIIKYKKFVPQIIRKFGSKTKSEKQLTEFYKCLIEEIQKLANFDSWEILPDYLDEHQEKQILGSLVNKFTFLTPAENEFDEPQKGKSFAKEVKTARIIADDLDNCKKCAICGGRIQSIAISIDHEKDKKYNGDNSFGNSKTTHYYCNTGFKNYLQSLGIEVKYRT